MLVIKWSAKLLDIHIESDVATDIYLDGAHSCSTYLSGQFAIDDIGAHSTRHYTKGNFGDDCSNSIIITLHVLVASSLTRVLRCQKWCISSPVRAFSVQM